MNTFQPVTSAAPSAATSGASEYSSNLANSDDPTGNSDHKVVPQYGSTTELDSDGPTVDSIPPAVNLDDPTVVSHYGSTAELNEDLDPIGDSHYTQSDSTIEVIIISSQLTSLVYSVVCHFMVN